VTLNIFNSTPPLRVPIVRNNAPKRCRLMPAKFFMNVRVARPCYDLMRGIAASFVRLAQCRARLFRSPVEWVRSSFNLRPSFYGLETMDFPSAIVVFWGIILLRTALSVEGSGIYHITMVQPAPYYSPFMATVPSGYDIQWDNKTATAHTVTHDDCLTENDCAFDSGSVASGKSFTLSFLAPGKYPYFCRLHPIMRGTLIVKRNKIATGT
jgi:plastocyanin